MKNILLESIKTADKTTLLYLVEDCKSRIESNVDEVYINKQKIILEAAQNELNKRGDL